MFAEFYASHYHFKYQNFRSSIYENMKHLSHKYKEHKCLNVILNDDSNILDAILSYHIINEDESNKVYNSNIKGPGGRKRRKIKKD
ncbi:unnamed protein product [Gordionus sp. m RMFG-2023]